MVQITFICKAKIDTQRINVGVPREQTGEWDELGDTHTLLCIKQLTHEKLLHNTGALLSALWRPTCEAEQTQGESESEAWHAAVHAVTKSWTPLSN